MEVRFFKKSERQLLLDSIDRLWGHDHIYVRKPEVMEHLVLHTPYRADFAGEENYSYIGMWDDEGNVIGLYGSMPQKFNVFGREYISETATTWYVDKKCGKHVDGLELRDYAYVKGVRAAVYFGLSDKAYRIDKAYGAYMTRDFPRWIGINRVKESLEFLLPSDVKKELLPVLCPIKFKGENKIEYDDLNQEKWDAYYFRHFASVTIGTQRDYQFLKWRYMESPVLKYQVIAIRDVSDEYLGLAVVRKESILDGRFFIGRILEFISLNEVASVALASAVIQSYPDVLAWDFYCLSDVTAYGLEMNGFQRMPPWMERAIMPTRFQPIDYDRVRINGAVYLDEGLQRKVKPFAKIPWYLTRGDSDQDRAN